MLSSGSVILSKPSTSYTSANTNVFQVLLLEADLVSTQVRPLEDAVFAVTQSRAVDCLELLDH